METYDTVIAGLGGQGILLVSRILMAQGLQRGSPVRGAETHGMAQRGGSVVAHVRVGACESPEVLPGHAHLVLALEHHEGMRALPLLRPGGTLIVNASGPEALAAVGDYLTRLQARVRVIPGAELARQAGNPRSLNMVLLGAACSLQESPFDLEAAIVAVRSIIKPRFHASSLQALSLGAAQI